MTGLADQTSPAAPAPLVAERETWLDVARGIGIVLMVHGHIVFGLDTAHLLGPNPNSGWLYINYLIYCFHMAVFFVASGVPAAKGLERGAWAFLRPRLWTVVYPYFLWSAIQLATKLLLGGAVNHPVDPHALLSLPWRPIEQFWFLHALALCQLCAALVPRRLLAPAALAGFAVPAFVPNIGALASAVHFLPFYVAGILLSARMIGWHPGTWWLLSWAGLLLFGTLLWQADAERSSIEMMLAGIFGVIGTFALAKRARGRWAAVAAWLGRLSMTIFVLHVFAGAGIRILLVQLGVTDPWLHYAAGMAAGLGLSVLAHLAFQRLGLLPWLGLAPLPRKGPATPAPNMLYSP